MPRNKKTTYGKQWYAYRYLNEKCRYSQAATLKWEDIHFEDEGITILITRSKTDQIGEGQTCAIPYGRGEQRVKGGSMVAMRQGHWRHEGTVYGYIEEGQRFTDNAVNKLFSEI